MSVGMGLGLLGGIVAMAALAYSWDGSLDAINNVAFNLLVATMFFATAGAFAKTAPIAGKSIAVIAGVCVAVTLVSMFYGSTFLWVQIFLLAIGVVNVALAACPTVVRYGDSRKAV
ncbi:MAG: hypothetical protein IKQ60_00025 [Candidatus Methanomethylophilaceae archaeon]|nr:hypothetical protein [Candidatus Methanomethylophilaceae archaeon]